MTFSLFKRCSASIKKTEVSIVACIIWLGNSVMRQNNLSSKGVARRRKRAQSVGAPNPLGRAGDAYVGRNRRKRART